MRRKKRAQRQEEREARELEALEARVHAALRDEGGVIPQTEEEVARAEADWAKEPVELPEGLLEPPDLEALSSDAPRRVLRPPGFAGPARIFDDMARAAREGKPIPEEIEETLRRDREAAEREAEEGTEDGDASDESSEIETKA
jgi:hypothetical protein